MSANSPAAGKYHGLYNKGATCYLNSVLQVLFMTKEFRDAVSSAVTGIDRDLKDLFDDLLRGSTDTHKIIKALNIDGVYEQRDAAEYFEKILNQTSKKAAKIFRGEMAHRTDCSDCKNYTDTDGPFRHLPLELLDSCSENYSVVDGIKKYFRASNVCEDSQMYCDSCDRKVNASSKYVIKHHPNVLVLMLKRFDFSYRCMSYVKITCDVDVPYTLKIPEDQTYELYAVVDHFGSLRGGHYAATIKSQEDEDKWFSFDDIRVTPLDRSPFTDKQDIARFANAYLLFYRQKAEKQVEKRPKDANTDEKNPTKKTGEETDDASTDEQTKVENSKESEETQAEKIKLHFDRQKKKTKKRKRREKRKRRKKERKKKKK